jgi:hypothetical protein
LHEHALLGKVENCSLRFGIFWNILKSFPEKS